MHTSLESRSWRGLLNGNTPNPDPFVFESLIRSPWKLLLGFHGLPENLCSERRLCFFPLCSVQWHVEGECKPGACSACATADQRQGACPIRNLQSWEPATPTSAQSLGREVKLSSACHSSAACLELQIQQKSPFALTPAEDLLFGVFLTQNSFSQGFQLLSDPTASLFSKWTLLKQTWECTWDRRV